MDGCEGSKGNICSIFRIMKKKMILKRCPSLGIEFNLNSNSLCLLQVKTIRTHNAEFADSDNFVKPYNGIPFGSLIFIYYHGLINSVFDT